jgi:hypothetical protein
MEIAKQCGWKRGKGPDFSGSGLALMIKGFYSKSLNQWWENCDMPIMHCWEDAVVYPCNRLLKRHPPDVYFHQNKPL